MVFKRRDRRPVWKIVLNFLWPRGGWGRAARYIKHRLRRLPDTPEKICRGIWAGIFTTFTPFYGLHFILSLLLAKAMRGNIVAALLATFFGNPLTYVPIGIISLNTGYFILGRPPHGDLEPGFIEKFSGAGRDLWNNFLAAFTADHAEWDRLERFYHEVLLPYTVGGIIPGFIAATIAYSLCIPVVRAYQNHRRKILRSKLDTLKSPGGSAPDSP